MHPEIIISCFALEQFVIVLLQLSYNINQGIHVCVYVYVCTYILYIQMYVRHRISSQTENSSEVKIAHVILVVIYRLTVLVSTFYYQAVLSIFYF
jgi:hypothetical protein